MLIAKKATIPITAQRGTRLWVCKGSSLGVSLQSMLIVFHPVFEPEQILPRYIITFATQDAEEREQEG